MKLTLGTVQFGINYGISNTDGVPSDAVLSEILDLAKTAGMDCLDTANAYGNAEERLGLYNNNRFKVVTKFPKVTSPNELKSSLNDSLQKLKQETVYGYLAHNADILIENPKLWQTLLQLKEEKKVQKIGYSLYDPLQLQKLLELDCIPDLVQLPYSMLDRKFESAIEVLKKQGTEIHVRSVFLQGLYFMDPQQLPEKLQPLEKALSALHQISKEEKIPVSAIALHFVLQNQNIDQVIIGVATVKQLRENIDMVNDCNCNCNESVFSKIRSIEILNKELLNPVNW